MWASRTSTSSSSRSALAWGSCSDGSGTLAWKPGKRPLPEKGAPKKGRRGESDIVSLKEIALALPARAWRTVKWREATCDVLSSRFARVRVHVAHRHLMVDRHAEEWLLIEWPRGQVEPTKYWLSTVERNIAFDRLVIECTGLADPAPVAQTFFIDEELRERYILDGIITLVDAVTTRGEDGAASTITSPSASPPTASWSPRGRPFPPRRHIAPCSARRLPYPRVGARGDLPLRPERHVPTSIATLRRRLIVGITKRLPRCPCCQASTKPRAQTRKM